MDWYKGDVYVACMAPAAGSGNNNLTLPGPLILCQLCKYSRGQRSITSSVSEKVVFFYQYVDAHSTIPVLYWPCIQIVGFAARITAATQFSCCYSSLRFTQFRLLKVAPIVECTFCSIVSQCFDWMKNSNVYVVHYVNLIRVLNCEILAWIWAWISSNIQVDQITALLGPVQFKKDCPSWVVPGPRSLLSGIHSVG